MAIYFRFDHTGLENNIQKLDLADRTKQTTCMTRLVTFMFLVTSLRHGHDPPAKFGSHLGDGVALVLVATSLESGVVRTSISLD